MSVDVHVYRVVENQPHDVIWLGGNQTARAAKELLGDANFVERPIGECCPISRATLIQWARQGPDVNRWYSGAASPELVDRFCHEPGALTLVIE